jgi:hypothetical protein
VAKGRYIGVFPLDGGRASGFNTATFASGGKAKVLGSITLQNGIDTDVKKAEQR